MKKALKRKNMYRLLVLAAVLFLMLGWVAFSGTGHESKSSFVYRIALDSNWSPIDFMGKEQQIAAFSEELIRSISDEEELQVSFFNTGANALIGGLNSGQFDVILSGMPPVPSTEKLYVYSQPYYHYGPVLVVETKSDFSHPKQLDGKIIGIERGSPALFNLTIDPRTTLVSYENILEAFEAMTRGEIDGVILNAMPAYLYAQSLYTGNIKVISKPLTIDALRLIARRNRPGADLIESFNKGLEKMKADGRYDALLKRWGLPNQDVK